MLLLDTYMIQYLIAYYSPNFEHLLCVVALVFLFLFLVLTFCLGIFFLIFIKCYFGLFFKGKYCVLGTVNAPYYTEYF